MNPERLEISDNDRSSLRTIVAKIDRELANLSLEGSPEAHRAAERGLAASWAQLVAILALGPAPEVRECAVCTQLCMRAATRCGHCWSELPPYLGPTASVQ